MKKSNDKKDEKKDGTGRRRMSSDDTSQRSARSQPDLTSAEQPPKSGSRATFHIEGEGYKSKKASEFMPELLIPGVKVPPSTAPPKPSPLRRSFSEGPRDSDTAINEQPKPGFRRQTLTSSNLPKLGEAVTDRFHATTLGPADTNQEDIKVKFTVLSASPNKSKQQKDAKGHTGPGITADKTKREKDEPRKGSGDQGKGTMKPGEDALEKSSKQQLRKSDEARDAQVTDNMSTPPTKGKTPKVTGEDVPGSSAVATEVLMSPKKHDLQQDSGQSTRRESNVQSVKENAPAVRRQTGQQVDVDLYQPTDTNVDDIKVQISVVKPSAEPGNSRSRKVDKKFPKTGLPKWLNQMPATRERLQGISEQIDEKISGEGNWPKWRGRKSSSKEENEHDQKFVAGLRELEKDLIERRKRRSQPDIERGDLPEPETSGDASDGLPPPVTDGRSDAPPKTDGRSVKPPKTGERSDAPPKTDGRSDKPPKTDGRSDKPPKTDGRSDKPPKTDGRSDKPPKTETLMKPKTQKVESPDQIVQKGPGRRVVVGNLPKEKEKTITEHEGKTVEVDLHQPTTTNTDNIKVQISVIRPKPKPVETILPPPPPPPPKEEPKPPPPPPPPPPPKEEPKPESPPPEKHRSKSDALLDFLKNMSRRTSSELGPNEVPSPELVEDNIDVCQVLKKFNFPDQQRALDILLNTDSIRFDFGGLLWYYYSYVLRSYSPINMQDRYRGVAQPASCFTSVDLSQIGTREEETNKLTKAKLRKIDEKKDQLRNICFDDDHFEYLRNLGTEQQTLLPLTIVHMLNEQMAPILEDIFRFYGKNLGTDHKATKEAGFHYMKIRKRCEMYTNICGGTTINENENLAPYFKNF